MEALGPTGRPLTVRVLVTGAAGQLGRELMTVLPHHGHDARGIDIDTCDLAVEGAAAEAIRQHRPEVVVNCAAWTRVDAAETEPAGAQRANVVAPRLLARACAGAGLRLVHISTDFVFDGSARQPIPESAAPRPLGAYGGTKLAGETAVREEAPDHVIVRTSWLFGQSGPNFVLTMLRLARENRPLRVVGDQRGSPTWTGHLAPALVELLEGAGPPLYHLTNSGDASWAEFAAAVVAEAGIDAEVIPITTEEYPTPALRPPYSVLDNRAWREQGRSPLPHWRQALSEYLASRRGV